MKKRSIIEGIRDDPEGFVARANQAKIIKRLSEMVKPHAGQIEPGRKLFHERVRFMFLQCGRTWGKTFFEVYAHVRKCSLFSNMKTYIVLPELNQARDVVWESGMFQRMIPREYLPDDLQKAFNKSDLRVRWKNGSYIRLLGADNPDSLRGIKPHLVSFDEYRDFKEDVFDIMEPNLGINDATLLICSTPPDREGHYTNLCNFFRQEQAAGNSDYYYLELPTSTNPYYPKERLERTKAAMIKRGEHAKYLREYEAKFIPGGVSSIFPMFGQNKKQIVTRPALLKSMIEGDRKKFDFYCSFDPATNSVFAVLLAAVNKYTGQLFILDEIYERDQMKTSSLLMWDAALQKKEIYNPELSDWTNIYDEQAAWFFNDLVRHHVIDNHNIQPTNKAHRNKLEDLSMLKDLFLKEGHIQISERCAMTVWELENYVSDKNGDPQKKDDHEIDNIRYILSASDFEPASDVDPDFKLDEDLQMYVRKSAAEVLESERAKLDPDTGLDMDTYGDDDIESFAYPFEELQ